MPKAWAKINRDAPESERLADLFNRNPSALAMFWPLKALSDDFGRYTANPRRFAHYVGGLAGISPEQASEMMADMAACGVISLYEVDGEQYLEIADYHHHDAPNWMYVGGPEYPTPPGWEPPQSLTDFIREHANSGNVTPDRYGILANISRACDEIIATYVGRQSNYSATTVEPQLNHPATTVEPSCNYSRTTVPVRSNYPAIDTNIDINAEGQPNHAATTVELQSNYSASEVELPGNCTATDSDVDTDVDTDKDTPTHNDVDVDVSAREEDQEENPFDDIPSPSEANMFAAHGLSAAIQNAQPAWAGRMNIINPFCRELQEAICDKSDPDFTEASVFAALKKWPPRTRDRNNGAGWLRYVAAKMFYEKNPRGKNRRGILPPSDLSKMEINADGTVTM